MYYINGKFVEQEEAKISVLDLSILRGFAAFDYLRTYRKKPFHLWEHLLRLQYSCEEMGIVLPKSLDEIEKIVLTLLERTDFPEASLKLIVTGGVSPDQITPLAEASHLIAFAYPLSVPPESYYLDGIDVITTRLNRSLPTCKTTQYTSAIAAMQKAKSPRPKEILYVNDKEEILEATTSNFFGFKKGILHTCCSEGVLTGITREVVLRLVDGIFPVEKRALSLQELSSVEEAFITASNKEVLPVVEIDGQKIGNGKVGPRTKELMRLFREYTAQEHWPKLQIERYEPSLLNI